MRLHTENFKNNIKEMGRELDSKITYTLNEEVIELGNDNLNSVTPVVQSSLLKSVMKELDIDSNVDIPLGTVVNYKFGIAFNGSDYEYLDFGDYIVYSSEKQEDTNSYNIVCYDRMLASMVTYEKLQTDIKQFPMTVRDYIDCVCADLGLFFKNKDEEFANYDKVIQIDLYEGLEYTYRDVLDELAQVTASNIIINENNELEIKYITDTNDIINEEYLKDVNVAFGEKYGPINSIVLSRAAESDNVYLRDEKSVEEDGLCEIKIKENQIMNFNDRSDYLPDILNKLNGLEFYTNDFTSTGICYYDVCDKYYVQIGDETYQCVMFNDQINITQGLEEIIFTDLPEQAETDYTKADKTDRRINQTYIIVDKQNQKIESVVSQVDEQEEKITQVVQDTERILQEVSHLVDITTEDSSTRAKISFKDLMSGYPLNLKIHPLGSSILSLYPSNNIYPTNEYFPGIEGLVPRVGLTPSETLVPNIPVNAQDIKYPSNSVVEFHNTTTGEIISYTLPSDLLYYDATHYDEFQLDYESQKCIVIKRIGQKDDGTLYILDKEEIIEYDYPIIELTAGDYEISVVGYELGYIYGKFVLQSEYTDIFATKVEMNSSIEQTARKIQLQVDEKVGDDEIIAKLNVAVENDQGIVELVGNSVTIDSDNFKLDKEGNIDCNNASMTDVSVKGGNIELYDVGDNPNPSITINNTSYNNSKAKITSAGMSFTNDFDYKLTITPLGTTHNASQAGTTMYTDLNYFHLALVRGDAETLITPDGIETPSLMVTGSKNRVVEIDNGEKVLLNAYETPTPYFGDIGSNKTDENGYCKIFIEDIFSQTIEIDTYKVFIQECGKGHLYIKKYDDYFEVIGTPNLEFDWEIKAIQKGYKNTRLKKYEAIKKESDN